MKLRRHSSSGVALVITLILLSVITFLAVTFLAVSRNERRSVTTTTDQNLAKYATEGGFERAKVEVIAPILANTNPFAFGLLVSTNYINPAGYQTGKDGYTNVSYSDPNGNPITGNDFLRNQANLFYNPRPPVYIITNRNGYADFRYYLDLNRNGRYDTNGYTLALGPTGRYLHPNGTEDNNPVNGITNYYTGDPEWIGILERPDLPHSSTNFFRARYAYIVVPAGKTLDLNYIHNQASTLNLNASQDGFFRNQGVGSWEINFAAFLRDLNTNSWDTYNYQRGLQPPFRNTGTAFEDAFSLLNYRYASNYFSLSNAAALYANAGKLNNDFVDNYGLGPLMTSYHPLEANNDPLIMPWAGANNPQHFFTTQELFQKIASGAAAGQPSFYDRLYRVGTSNSTYDRYTFYRFLEQVGTDSSPEAGKINLNYTNVNTLGQIVPSLATNFGDWKAVEFFTNAADQLLQATFTDINANIRLFGVTNTINLHNIPVFINGRFVYSPSLHRVLQVAANIYDASSSTKSLANGNREFPSVFRPLFETRNGSFGTDIYITNFVYDPYLESIQTLAQRNLSDTNVAANVRYNDLIYGVPLVIGAKKGLPNFNEFAMQTIVQTTRKLQVTRSTLDSNATYQTNQMYVVGISNAIGMELWNSYASNYNRGVDVYYNNSMSMTLTNNDGMIPRQLLYVTNNAAVVQIAANTWRGIGLKAQMENRSFRVPFYTNIAFLPEAVYVHSTHFFDTNLSRNFETGQGFPLPQFGLAITNNIRMMMVDSAPDFTGQHRIIDYVQLGNLGGVRNLSEELRDSSEDFAGVWKTNRMGGSDVTKAPEGIINQIQISLGNVNLTPEQWNSYSRTDSGNDKEYSIQGFRSFFGLSSTVTTNGNFTQQAPFTPFRRITQRLTWQANDPLVHYTATDLTDLSRSNTLQYTRVVKNLLENSLGSVNNRYQPWGGSPKIDTSGEDLTSDPDAYNFALKDPLVTKSDTWEFPTNKFPNIGWLGRVHRGTPWQTIYMKASDINLVSFPTAFTNSLTWATYYPENWRKWAKWSGYQNLDDAYLARPVMDRAIFDVFTAAVNENATRGQLPINQTNQAAWSAVFGGALTLSNTASDATLNLFQIQSPVPPLPTNYFTAFPIDPVGTDGTNAPLARIVNGINRTRMDTNQFAGQYFPRLGDVLATPELTDQSPYLNQLTDTQRREGLNDQVYEWLPQQVMSLLRLGDTRFVVYSFGQTLRPAPSSVVASGQFLGMCTNYQITAEMAVRAVVRIEGSPNPANTSTNLPLAQRYPPRVVVESYNLLPPD